VVVGNLTVGGTGKTPLVAWLARELSLRGLRPAIVSRGYGGTSEHTPRRVVPDGEAREFGDEPLLLAAQTGCPIWVGRDRLAAARSAVEAGAELLISDDGLQHYRLRRDLEIAVVDGQRGFGNGHCLPAGPLREPLARLQEVDFVVCNGGPHCPEGALAMRLAGDHARRIGDAEERPLAAFDSPVHAVAGIGNPERFFRQLEAAGLQVMRHPLADHADVLPTLLRPSDGRPVLMTSKDAARCGRHAAGCWEVPVQARVEEGERLLARVLALAET
jgi:tetraacyldisaccharide 4'-kinase